jgi:hypothetical protein
MKVHTTNYKNTFIEIAEDCPVVNGEIPPVKKERSVANIQFDMISEHPYKYDSDEVVFLCFAEKNKIRETELKAAREQFFSKGQACLRCSPLTKRYGFGVHFNKEGKVAIYPAGSAEYNRYLNDKTLTRVKAMRSKRA